MATATGHKGHPAQISLRAELIVLSLLVVAYCLIQFHGLLSPGLLSDEAKYGVLAQQTINLGLRNSRSWPLAVGYHGALQIYLYVPFFLLIKNPEIALRTGEVFFGLIVLLLTYLCARRFFNPLAAIFTSILLLANPTFIYMSRVSAAHGGVMTAFYLGTLLCLHSWRRSGKDGHLFAAALLAGAGCCIALLFFWFAFGLLLTAFVFRKELFILLNRPAKARRMSGAGLFFLLGFSPYIVREIAVILGRCAAPELFSYGIAHLHHTQAGANNFAVFGNLATSLRQFAQALAGVMSWGYIADYSLSRTFVFCLELYYGFLLAFSIPFLLNKRHEDSRGNALFFIVLLAGMFLPSILTLSGFSQVHFFILFPLPQIIMGAAAYLLLEEAWAGGPGRFMAIFWLSLFAAAPVIYAREFARMERYVIATGGAGESSDATDAMTAWLLQNRYLTPKVEIEGVPEAIRVLSDENVNPFDCWPELYTSKRAQDQYFLKTCSGGSNIFIFPAPERTEGYFSPYIFPILTAILRRNGKRFSPQKTFFDRTGKHVYTAYSIESIPRDQP